MQINEIHFTRSILKACVLKLLRKERRRLCPIICVRTKLNRGETR